MTDSSMKSRFDFENPSNENEMVFPVACSEAVSQTNLAGSGGRFVIEEPADTARATEIQSEVEKPETEAEQAGAMQRELISPELDSTWRNEVADRVNRYRARRNPRAPRYPSLTLKFDSPDSRSAMRPLPDTASRQALAMDSAFMPPETFAPAPIAPVLVAPEIGKLIEFPRSVTLAPRPLDELADPVMDRPRILEVPEVAPPPPALGGILIEPVERKVEEKRPGFEIPLQPARMSRRMAAAAFDGLVVLAAASLFVTVFFRITATVPPLLPALGMGIWLATILGAGYQFLLLIFTGTTPGLKLAKLELRCFDGQPVPRRMRRWRLLASVLSGISLGLGYAWCLLDEDQLCWHDRITHTYMAPKSNNAAPNTKK
jgi:uncharacterized RDD family membrane protein YckC